MIDVFKHIHDLLVSNDYELVLDEVLNFETGRIKAPYSEDLNHAWYIVGDCYFKLSDYQMALRAFKNSLRNRKSDYQAMVAIANCHSEMGKPKQAKHYLLKAILSPEAKAQILDAIRYDLGNAYFDMHKYELAFDEYMKVRKSAPEVYSLARKNIELIQSKYKDKTTVRSTHKP